MQDTTTPTANTRISRVTTTSELKKQVKELQEQVATLLREREDVATSLNPTNRIAQQTTITPTPRVPTNLPKFNGQRDEDVRQWLFQVENTCRIHSHIVCDENTVLPSIAGTAMEGSASGWFLHWASTIPNEDQTWKTFTSAALAHFEASNYQANMRQRLRGLKQVNNIEEYNGKYSEMIFRIENMSDIDQISNYCAGLKPKTRAYVQIEDPGTLSEAMDFATRFEMAHFSNDNQHERKVSIIKNNAFGKKQYVEKDQDGKKFKFKGRYKKFDKPYKSRYNRTGDEKKQCNYCKKNGHLMKDCYSFKRKQKQENVEPRPE